MLIIILIYWQLSLGQAYFFSYEDSFIRIEPEGHEFVRPIGGAIVFDCVLSIPKARFSDSLQPSVLWFNKEDVEINLIYKDAYVYVEETTNDKESETYHYSKRLYISRVSNEHAGTYHCNMSHRSDIHASVSLLIYRDLEFVPSPNEIYALPNTSVRLDCSATGEPKPSISWKFNGKKLKTDDKIKITEEGLEIRFVGAGDAGAYRCLAEVREDARFIEKIIHLQIATAPVFTGGLNQSMLVSPGSDLKVDCGAMAIPPPSYQFFKLNYTGSKQRWHLDELGGMVTIKDVDGSDGGRYVCVVTNMAGSVNSSFTLKVASAPRITKFEDIQDFIFMSATFTCFADQPVDVEFVVNNQTYTHGNHGRFTVQQLSEEIATLHLSDLKPSDAGDVICRIRTTFGSHNMSATLTVLYSPIFTCGENATYYADVPKIISLRCCVCSHPPSSLHWIHPSSKTISKIEPTVDCIESDIQVEIKETITTEKFGSYLCSANNSLTEKTIQHHVRSTGAPDAPKMIEVGVVSSRWASLRVQPGAEDGGHPVLRYRIQYDDVTLHFDTDQEIIVDNLRPCTQYVLEVASQTQLTHGPPASVFVSTNCVDVPMEPVITSERTSRHRTSYVVEWIISNDGGMPVNRFILSLQSLSIAADVRELEHVTLEDCQPTALLACKYRLPLHHLRSDHEYIVHVEATNVFGSNKMSRLPPFVFKTSHVDLDEIIIDALENRGSFKTTTYFVYCLFILIFCIYRYIFYL